MLDLSSHACFDFLDAIVKFYSMLVSTGLFPAAGWISTQEFMARVFEEIEYVSLDAGEEDMDAGFIWSSMLVCNKVSEFQHFCWAEHPIICSMLMFSVLERLGEEHVTPEDAAADEALEQCRKNHEAIMELVEKQKSDHKKAANAINQVIQLKTLLKAQGCLKHQVTGTVLEHQDGIKTAAVSPASTPASVSYTVSLWWLAMLSGILLGLWKSCFWQWVGDWFLLPGVQILWETFVIT